MRPFGSAVLTVVAVLIGLRVADASIPAEVTHTLTPSCHWEPKPWATRLHLGYLASERASRAQYACLTGRGLKSPSPFVKTILTRWPDETGHPLPPGK